ncbi:hypothetical protein [Spiroplasma eriocheiris]|uniref:Uncharacterized protein n=1 Tax=Spiroplasma eriocheiris TaxID=315358 RepID=A0A0H3XKB3_9MOLU|nr:hypothetical protein [Spiroplasma eriocheiris]AKM53819.1 hypothetical protein SERIO_v1c02310 [Spiroplasma eriocheiris]
MAAAHAKPAQFDEFMHLTDNDPGIKAMELGMQIKLHINLKFSDVNYKLFLSGINQFLTSLVNFEGDDTSWDALDNDSNYKWTTIDKLHHATLGKDETGAYDKFWASNNNTNYSDEVNKIMGYDPSGTSPTGFVKNSLYDVLYSWGHDNNGDMYNALYGPEGAFAKGLIDFNKSADFVYDNLYGPWLDDNKYWTYENVKHQYDTTGKLAVVSFDIEYHGLGDLSTNLDAHKQAVDLDKLKNDEQYRASWNGTGLYFDPADPSKVLYGQVKNKYHVEWTNIGTSVLNDMMLTDMKWYQPNGVDYYYL